MSVIAGRDRLCKAEAGSLKVNVIYTTVLETGEKLMSRQYEFGLYCLPSATSQGIYLCKILNTKVLFQVCLFSLLVLHCWRRINSSCY